MRDGNERLLNVVGVVPDARWSKTDDDDLAAYYVLAESYNSANIAFVRTAGRSAASASAIRGSLKEYNPNIVVTSTTSMEELLARSMAEERFRASLSIVFGGASLVLAAVGLYGLATRRVADRSREIGVRIALGARPGDVRRLVIFDGLRTIAIGLVVGLPAAFAAVQLTPTLLYGVTSTSLRVFVAAAAALSLAALIATILPARRAAMIDPLQILRD
jgi:ABC-type antimicrobial peptide transport system permease subunit